MATKIEDKAQDFRVFNGKEWDTNLRWAYLIWVDELENLEFLDSPGPSGLEAVALSFLFKGLRSSLI